MNDLLRVLDAIQGVRVAVIGDLMVDRYVYGAAERLSPEAPVPVMRAERSEKCLGGAANVAANIKALGAEPILVGAVAHDLEGGWLSHELSRQNITQELVWHHESTTLKTRYVANGQQLMRVDRDGAVPQEYGDQLLKMAERASTTCQAIVVSDYGKGGVTLGLLRWAIAQRPSISVIIDPSVPMIRHCRGASVILPNRRQFEMAAGQPFGDGSLREMGGQLDVDHLVVTLGAEGMSCCTSSGNITHFPTRPVLLADVAGAGDTVTAVVGAGAAAGQSTGTALKLANVTAGIIVQKRGTAVATAKEVRRSLTTAEWKIWSCRDLKARVKDWRKQKLTVGLANGVFDLIHSGHLSLLHQARVHCDRLIVAINDDWSVRKLKGKARPVQWQDERAQALAALHCVDAVAFFSDTTPEKLIEELRPDVLIKGGDYPADEIVGRDIVEARGGKVVIVPLLAGHSTSGTIEKFKAT